MVTMTTVLEEAGLGATPRPSVGKRVRMAADTIRAINRMSLSFNRRSSDAMTSSLPLPLGPLPSRPSVSLTLPAGAASVGAGGVPLGVLPASGGPPRRRWRRGSVSEGGALGPARRMALSREISAENENDPRRRNSRTKHPKHRRDLLAKFRLAGRLTVFCARQAREHRLKDKLYDEIMPYVNEMRFHDYEKTSGSGQGGLSFDPSNYKADTQLRISEETKRVLTLLPSERTEKEVTYAQLSLRNIQSIAEYPVRMQRKLVEVGRYEKYDAKRVIVRQGHPATAFYFILSGSVVVMVMDPETKVAKPVAYLLKGKPFGELAIMQRTTRQASIIAKETLELLSIDIEDFHRIFMAGGVKNIHDPDHNQFISNLRFLREWPLEKMAVEPDKCQFFFFKQGDIVVRDSRKSRWLVIVKSGSLQVLKKLKRVEAFEWKKKEAHPTPKVKGDKEKKEEKEQRDKQRRYILPELRIPLRDSDLDPDPPELPDMPPMTSYSAADASRTRRLSRWTTETPATSGAKTDQSKDSFVTSFPSLSRSNGVTRPQSCTVGPGSGGEMAGDDQLGNKSRENSQLATSPPTKAKAKKPLGRRKKEEEQEEVEREMKGRKQEVRTITQDLDDGYKQTPDELTEADLDPQFVHVQTLTKGQVFGLSELVLGNQPSFCVVSNGAECILVDKHFYKAHAPEELLRRVRNECCPYPSDDEMQQGLQASVDWHAYKDATFRDTLTLINQKKKETAKSYTLVVSLGKKKRTTRTNPSHSRPVTR